MPTDSRRLKEPESKRTDSGTPDKGPKLRKLVVAEFVSLDGYIAGPSGHLDFGGDIEDEAEEMPKEMVATQRQWGTLLMGRRTYEEISESWAPVPIEGNPVATFMNTVPKVVVSRTLNDAPWGKWERARIISRQIGAELERLRREPGKDIAILGSASLVQQLARKGLVDEIKLIVFPVIVGGGTPLFSRVNHGLRLRLAESRRHKSGVLVLRYVPMS